MTNTHPRSMTNADFDKKLNAFSKTQAVLMKSLHALADAAFLQFAEHGDTSFINNLFNTISKNVIRRDAFMKWLVAHAPLKMEKGVWVKDKGPTASALNVEGALKAPFWEFAPAKEVQDFSADDIVQAVVKLVSKYENTNKFHAANDAATKKLAEVKRLAKELAGPSTMLPPQTVPHAAAAAAVGA